MERFYETTPDLQSYWRAVILFGRNVASYKFALAKSLLEFKDRQDDLIRIEELSPAFSRHICEHLIHAPKQATSRSSKFLEGCRKFNSGEISQLELDKITTSIGFNNVIDAFHIVNQGEIPQRFFIDERRENNGIRLTDNLFELLHDSQMHSFGLEVEARWRLVETAWAMNISQNLMEVTYQSTDELLTVVKGKRRVNVTSCKSALNGYQKGHCFYCFNPISIQSAKANSADVDHFFPHTLADHNIANPIDGVWNLVLACPNCNRGEDGKFARLPSLQLLERLRYRNDYLIGSHHPLRETLMLQTGRTNRERTNFLQIAYNQAKPKLVHSWSPKYQHDKTL